MCQSVEAVVTYFHSSRDIYLMSLLYVYNYINGFLKISASLINKIILAFFVSGKILSQFYTQSQYMGKLICTV